MDDFLLQFMLFIQLIIIYFSLSSILIYQIQFYLAKYMLIEHHLLYYNMRLIFDLIRYRLVFELLIVMVLLHRILLILSLWMLINSLSLCYKYLLFIT